MENKNILEQNYEQSIKNLLVLKDLSLNLDEDLKKRITDKLIQLHKNQLIKEFMYQRDYDDYRGSCAWQKAEGIKRSHRTAFRKYDKELGKLGFNWNNDKSQHEWRKVTLYMDAKYGLTDEETTDNKPDLQLTPSCSAENTNGR